MDLYLIVIGGVVVIAVSLGLAFLSNRAEEVKKVKGSKPLTKKKDAKKDAKKKKVNPKGKKEKEAINNNNFSANTASYEGDEDDAKSMLEFLKGTQNYKIQEAKEERRKRLRAEKKAAEAIKGVNLKHVIKEDESSDENIEYVLIKRKKADQPPAKKEKKAEAPAEEKEKKPAKEKRKKTEKDFFKRGLAKDLQNPLIKSEDEEEPTNKKGKKKVEGEENKENVPRKEKSNKPEGEEEQGVKKNNGPRQGGNTGSEARPPRERRPREAPPPPPRPLGGTYEAPSLDDMLSAISTYYTSSKPKAKAEETFFSKLPRIALFRALHALSVRDIIALSKVNHYLNKICRDEKLWRFLCERDFKMKFSDKAANQKRFKNIYREEYMKNKPKSDIKA